ncbi:MAG TPA: helix-turn-helix transcriptional regulator [Chondromyces sp.]|nr:helix-turn-helix transcriptional regulator [Chondromyces sp.]
MADYINPEKLSLSEDFFKLAVLEEVQNYIPNHHVIREWRHYITEEINETTGNEKECRSFERLCEVVRTLLIGRKVTRENLHKAFAEHYRFILGEIQEQIHEDFPFDVHISPNEGTVNAAKEEGALVSSMDFQLHLMRNIVTQPKNFSPVEEASDVYQAEIKDAKGNIQGLARVNVAGDLDMPFTDEEQEYWDKLRSAFNAMDELTADIFDIICFLFLFAPKDEDGYLNFHSNDALKLRSNVIDSDKSLDVRERDRFNIMSRVKALSNIWISLKEGELIEADENDLKESKKYKYRDWQKMFEVGRVRAAYDENDKFLGIYACQIKPTSLLTSFLNENKRLGVIDLAALEFHPIRHRAEKRLTRYLSIQWFIRLSKNSLSKPFSVRTLVQEMDFGKRLRGPDIYDRFVKALDELKDKGIVKEWGFLEEVDYSLMGKSKWLAYFYSLKVSIIPSAEMIERNRRKISILQNKQGDGDSAINLMLESFNEAGVVSVREQENAILEMEAKPAIFNAPPQTDTREAQPKASPITEDQLTPEMVIRERERRGLSLAKAAEEIGIGYNTLKRFENRTTKRRNKKNDTKITNWLNESITKTS